jgi:hypothetical protein
MVDAFRREGLEVEAVYAAIEVLPEGPSDDLASVRTENLQEAIDWLRRSISAEVPPNLGGLLGFDISIPIPHFHTALFYEHVRQAYPALRSALNEHGLVQELDVARSLMDLANRGERLPHCVIGVWMT